MDQVMHGRMSTSELADELIDQNLPKLREAQRKVAKKNIEERLGAVGQGITSIHDPRRTVSQAAQAGQESFPDQRAGYMFWPEDIDVLLMGMRDYMGKCKKKWIDEAARDADAMRVRVDCERAYVAMDRAFPEGTDETVLGEMSPQAVFDLVMEECRQISFLYNEDREMLSKAAAGNRDTEEQRTRDSASVTDESKEKPAVNKEAEGASCGKGAPESPEPAGDSSDVPDGEQQVAESLAKEPDASAGSSDVANLSRQELVNIYWECYRQVLGGEGSGGDNGPIAPSSEPVVDSETSNDDVRRLGSLAPGEVRDLMAERAREVFLKWGKEWISRRREERDSAMAAPLDKFLSVSDGELRDQAYRLKVDALFSLFFSPINEESLRRDMEEKRELAYELYDLASVNPQQLAKEYKSDKEAQEALSALDEAIADDAQRLDFLEKKLATPSKYCKPAAKVKLPKNLKQAIQHEARQIAQNVFQSELDKRIQAARKKNH